MVLTRARGNFSKSLERYQSVAPKIILSDLFVLNNAACEMTGLKKPASRRGDRCLEFGLKSLNHPQNSCFSPPNLSVENQLDVRKRKPYHVNFARTAEYKKKNNAISYIQRRLG